MYTSVAAVALMIGLGAVFWATTASQDGTTGGPRGTMIPVTASLTGTVFAVVAFGVLGVLMISGEYTTGMVRSSLTAVPRRLPVLWGKLAVFAGTIFAISVIASFISFFAGQALLSSRHLGVAHRPLPARCGSVAGAALYVTVAWPDSASPWARCSAAPPPGISTFAAVFFVIPPLTSLLPASISAHLAQYLPSNAGEVLWGGTRGLTNALSPWTGFAVLCGYAVVLIAAAAWRLRRADA